MKFVSVVTLRCILGCLLLGTTCADALYGQDRGERRSRDEERRGDDDRDGDRRGDGDEGRGFGGRGGWRGGGGPGGGFGGGGGPQEFLRRMDRNGNGSLDPDEAEASRFFIDRIARQVPNIDFSRPVPIEQLADAMERMRRERFGDGGGRGDRDRDEDENAPDTPPPLVPGFGVDMQLSPVPGFGADAELFAVEIEDRDRRSAEDRMRRYDRNNDGVLSGEEIEQGRWNDDPFRYDRNRDGRLTVDEMAVRYAQRRASGDDEGSTRGKNQPKFYMPGGSSAQSSSSNSGPAAEPDERMLRMAEFTMRRFDKNGNGKLDKEEWEGMPSSPASSDRNRDGSIDQKELAVWLSNGGFGGGFGRRGGGGGRGGFARGGREGGNEDGGGGGRRFYSGREDRDDEDDEDEDEDNKNATTEKGETKSKFDRSTSALDKLESGLQKELPDWFIRNDRDEDAQVSMAEFSQSWSDEVVADFVKFDTNNDGVITAKECVAASKKGAKRGLSTSGSRRRRGGASGDDDSDGSSENRRPRRGDRNAEDESEEPKDGDEDQRERGEDNKEDKNEGKEDDEDREDENGEDGVRKDENRQDENRQDETENNSRSSARSTGASGVDARYARWAANIIREHDKNRDGVLIADEWSATNKDYSAADTNQDGKLTAEELVQYAKP